MGDEKDKEFRVIDKKGQAKETAKGDGFTMEGGKTAEPSRPNQVDFSTFVFSLATGAYINLGLAPDPTTNKTTKNLDLARQNIDILSLLKDKTTGNLSDDENSLLTNLLTDVRLKFVEVSKT